MRFYGASDKQGVAAAPVESQSKGGYADYYQRITEMSKDKCWNAAETAVALGDRVKGERQYEAVSMRFYLTWH